MLSNILNSKLVFRNIFKENDPKSIPCAFKLPAYICMSVIDIRLYKTAVYDRKTEFNYHA